MRGMFSEASRILRKPSKRGKDDCASDGGFGELRGSSSTLAIGSSLDRRHLPRPGAMQSAGKFLRSLRSSNARGGDPSESGRHQSANGAKNSSGKNNAGGHGALDRLNPFYHSDGKASRRRARVAAASVSSSDVQHSKNVTGSSDGVTVDRSHSLRSGGSSGAAQRRRFLFGGDSSPKNKQPTAQCSRAEMCVSMSPDSCQSTPKPLDNEWQQETSQNCCDSSCEVGGEFQRDRSERRSARKLTKDSGYETSPYSESEYVSLSTRSSSDETLLRGAPSPSEDGCWPVSDSRDGSGEESGSMAVRRRSSMSECSDVSSAHSGSTLVATRPEVICQNELPSEQRSLEVSATVTESPELAGHKAGITEALQSSTIDGPSLYSHANGVQLSPTGKLKESATDGPAVATRSHPADPDRKIPGDSAGDMLDQEQRDQEEYANHLRSLSYHMQHSRQWSGLSLHSTMNSNGERSLVAGEHQRQSSGNSGLSSNSCELSISTDTLDSEDHTADLHPAVAKDVNLDDNVSCASADKVSDHEESSTYDLEDIDSVLAVEVPVRDSSNIKNVNYSPGHEKFPSWPVHPPVSEDYAGGSHRSKSWTANSEYENKVEPVGVAKPLSKKSFTASFQRQLKTVMENCERIGPETFLPPEERERMKARENDPKFYPVKDYKIHSPPERDTNSAELASSSCVSNLTTPLLDQLRQDLSMGSTELLAESVNRDTSLWRGSDQDILQTSSGRDSVATVVTYSSSNSSGADPMRLYGSYSDISVVSSATTRSDPLTDHASATSQTYNNSHHVAHSTRVRPPVKLGSDSVITLESNFSRPNTLFPNSDAEKMFYNVKQTRSINLPNPEPSPSIDYSKPPSVTDRIKALEMQSRSSRKSMQSKSVPDLLCEKGNIKLSRGNSSRNQSLCEPSPPFSLTAPPSDSVIAQNQKTDHSSRNIMKTSESSLKTIQKMAVLSFYERQMNRNVNVSADASNIRGGSENTENQHSSDTNKLHYINDKVRTLLSDTQKDSADVLRSRIEEDVGSTSFPVSASKIRHVDQLSQDSSSDRHCQRIDANSRSSSRISLPSTSPSSVSGRTSQSARRISHPPTGSRHSHRDLGFNTRNSCNIPAASKVTSSPDNSSCSSTSSVSRCDVSSGDSVPATESPQHPLISRRLGDLSSAELSERPPRDSHCPPERPPKKPHLRLSSSAAAPQVAAPSQRVLVTSIDGGVVPTRPPKPGHQSPAGDLRPDSTASPVTGGEDGSCLDSEDDEFAPSFPVPPDSSNVSSHRLTSSSDQQECSDAGSYRKVQSPVIDVSASRFPANSSMVIGTTTTVMFTEAELRAFRDREQRIRDRQKQQRLSVTSTTSSDTPSSPLSSSHALTCVTAVSPRSSLSTVAPASTPPPHGDMNPMKSSTPTSPQSISPVIASGDCTPMMKTSSSSVPLLSPSPAALSSRSSLQAEQVKLKKDELVSRISSKLSVLKEERQAVAGELEANSALGSSIRQRLQQHSPCHHLLQRYDTHVQQVSTVTALLLGLSGRLARAQSAIDVAPEHCPDRSVLLSKRQSLLTQLREAEQLQTNIEQRGEHLSEALSELLTQCQLDDYKHFISMNAKLVAQARELDDKLRLGEEQLAAMSRAQMAT